MSSIYIREGATVFIEVSFMLATGGQELWDRMAYTQ